MRAILLGICLCLSAYGFSQKNSIRPIVLDGDSGVFMPMHYFDKAEQKLIFKNYVVREVKVYSEENTMHKYQIQNLTTALNSCFDQRDRFERQAEIQKGAAREYEKDSLYWQGQHKKAKNGGRFWRTVTAVVVTGGTILYLTK